MYLTPTWSLDRPHEPIFTRHFLSYVLKISLTSASSPFAPPPPSPSNTLPTNATASSHRRPKYSSSTACSSSCASGLGTLRPARGSAARLHICGEEGRELSWAGRSRTVDDRGGGKGGGEGTGLQQHYLPVLDLGPVGRLDGLELGLRLALAVSRRVAVLGVGVGEADAEQAGVDVVARHFLFLSFIFFPTVLSCVQREIDCCCCCSRGTFGRILPARSRGWWSCRRDSRFHVQIWACMLACHAWLRAVGLQEG